MSSHGTTCKLKIERLAAEGKIPQEYLGILDGSGNDQDFYTANFPITDSAGDATDDETDVDVFTDDGTPGSWTEYDDDGNDFVITGATGLVTVKAAENQLENADERISISYYTKAYVGRGQNVTVDQDSELVDIHELGSRIPTELKEGKITISGSIGQFYASRDLAGKFLGVSDFYQRLADFSFYLYPNGETAGQPQIKLSNVKFSGGSWGAAVDSILRLDVHYKGLAVEVDTVP